MVTDISTDISNEQGQVYIQQVVSLLQSPQNFLEWRQQLQETLSEREQIEKYLQAHGIRNAIFNLSYSRQADWHVLVRIHFTEAMSEPLPEWLLEKYFPGDMSTITALRQKRN